MQHHPKKLRNVNVFYCESKFSKITLKVKGNGEKKLLGCKVPRSGRRFLSDEMLYNYPDEVKINGIVSSSYNLYYSCSKDNNIVEMIWNYTISNCDFMFYNCPDITEIDLSGLNTTDVESMRKMFYSCSSLTSLNLSNFDTSQVTNMDYMFTGCSKLEYVNLKSFNNNKLSSFNNIFNGIADNLVVCINLVNNISQIFTKIQEKKCYNIDCSEDWKSRQKIIINATNGCECKLNNCLSCPPINETKELCTICNPNYFKMENDNIKIGDYFNCYKSPYGYYLDKKDSLYKQCYERCETCLINGNNITHNCLVCKKDYPIEINFNDYKNCYERCPYYFYLDEDKNFHCTIEASCPQEYPKLTDETKECIKEEYKYETTQNIIKEYSSIILEKDSKSTKSIDNKENIQNIIQKIIKYEQNKTKEKNMEEEIKYYDEVLKNIEDIFLSNDYNTTKLNNGRR